MPRYPWQLLRALSRLPSTDEAGPLPDAELLARFARSRDQAAFELLVWRHGPMVAGVCRRVLADSHAAEDAFQAAFLVLARKAGGVRTSGSAAGWLHRVARRVAVRAAKRATARGRRESSLTAEPLAREEPFRDPALRAVLDEEIDRLPDRLRLPVLLCYLEGRSTEDAAAVLGVPRGTVLSRLSAARTRLADRLTRRGVTAPIAALTATVAGTADLSADAVRGVVVGLGLIFHPGSAGPATPAYLLAQEVLRMSAWQKIAGATAAVLLAAGVGTGVVVIAGDGPGAPTAQAESPPLTGAKPPAATPPATAPTVSSPEPGQRLADSIRKIQDEILRRQNEAVSINRQADSQFDRKTLEKFITEINTLILSHQEQMYTCGQSVQRLQRQLSMVTIPERLNDEASLQLNQNYLSAQAAVEEARAKYQHLKKISAGENGAVKAALEQVRAATAAQEKVEKQHQDAAKENWRMRRIEGIESEIKLADEQIVNLNKEVMHLKERRRNVADLLADARRESDRMQTIEDELAVLRDVRRQIFKERIQRELGIEQPDQNRAK